MSSTDRREHVYKVWFSDGEPNPVTIVCPPDRLSAQIRGSFPFRTVIQILDRTEASRIGS